jgi:disulfide bond formation protein DsbB
VTLETLNHLIGFGTVAAQAATVLLLVLFIIREPRTQKYLGMLALPLAFVVTLGSVIMTLVYSDYFGIVPCWLCWYERVALYPQVLLFALAWWRKDAGVWLYSIALSLFGVVVSLYQHYLQMGGTSSLPCPASGGDCAQRFLFEFDYITFPLASFTLFALLIVLMLFYRRSLKV